MAFEGVTICDFLALLLVNQLALLTLGNITIYAQLSKVPHVNFLAVLLVIHIDEGWEWAGKAAG